MIILMIYYNFITIILFFVIFILILKFKDFRIENYQTQATLDCSDITNDSLDCNILRVMSDNRVNNHILQLLKNKINNESRDRIETKAGDVDAFLENTIKNKENVDKILGKLRKIDEDSDEKLNTYFQEKEKRDKYLVELTDSLVQQNEEKSFILTNDEFEEKNKLLKNKLAEYYDKIKNINKKSITKNENILILKNIGNNMELNLVDIGAQIKVYNQYKNLKSKIYHLIINDNCVNFIDKYNYKFENCNRENNFFFSVNKIENYKIYNKFIMYNKSSRDIHTIEADQENIEYPFYLICPFNNISVCVTYEDNKISFKPIRNNANQRFIKILNSNFCSYT
jgi:hypothetical protein